MFRTNSPNFAVVRTNGPIIMAALRKARNIFSRSDTVIVGYNPTRDMYVCLNSFFVGSCLVEENRTEKR
jgi:hypothetical protein